ncbi:membrane protein insertase YidC [Nocardia sp. NPDC052566]|uniref:membrane protein insertase YidC n=1 Tax=Nocardia sp. NPDC052566 TaxID=3364330 RepID=UPI0037CA30B2
MLDFVYYPVSAILWLWHTAFGFVLGPASGLSWVLSVVFLVLTVRAALFAPFLKQARTQATMKMLQPQVKAIQQKYKSDTVKRNTELQKLYKDNNVKVFGTILPMLAQLLVFLGLFHVLRSFDRTGTHIPFLPSGPTMSPEQNAATPNYLFSAEDVRSFLDAEIFGVPLSATMTTAGELLTTVALITVPLMLIAAVATHFTARTSMNRQEPTAQLALMRPLSLWVFPAFALIGGVVLPVAILLYFVTNNACTFAQQHLVYRRMDAETAAAAQRVAEARAHTAPKPGAKPIRRPKQAQRK